MPEPDPHIHGPEPTKVPEAIGSYDVAIFAESTDEAVGSITPDEETFGPMQGVSAAFADAKFWFAPASQVDAVQDDHSRPGITIVLPTYSFVNGPTPLTSISI